MNKILIPTFFSNYGGSVFVLLKSREILKKEFDVILKAPLKEADLNNFSISATINKKEQLKLLPKLVIHFFKELFWIKKNKIDIIYVHDFPALYIYGIIAKLLNIKLVWHVHIGEIKKIKRKINFILSYKRIYIAKFQIYKNDKNYCFIPNYVENLEIDKKIDKIQNIVIASSICNNKNQKFGIEVIKKTNKKLFLYGGILEKDYFENLEIDNRQIFYKGFEDKKRIFKFSDLVFMPSKEESWGLTFLEALANRVPVLVPNIVAFRELAKKINYEKYLYENDNIKDCLAKMELLENMNDKELERIQSEVIENFSLEKFKQNLLGCFNNV